MAPKRKRNLLTGKTATVTLTRGGLSIEVAGVPATDAGLAASAILNTYRQLVSAGYDELREFGPSLHGSPIEVPEDEDVPEFTVVPESARATRKIGF